MNAFITVNAPPQMSGLNCSRICSNCSVLGCDNRNMNIIDEDLEEENAMFEKD